MTAPKVPADHPRVYVRPADLPVVRAKLSNPQFAETWRIVREAADRPTAREADLGNRHWGGSDPRAGSAFCNAFIHLATGDVDRGRRAIATTLDLLPHSSDARTFHMPLHWAACVYDWCYDLLSPDQKQALIGEFIRIAACHPPGYPAHRPCNAVVGHDTEGWLLTGQLQAGVAIYDESSEMYDAAVRLFLDGFVPVRAYYYPGHFHHQGDHYATRLIYDLGASWLFRRMGAGDVLPRDQQFVPYGWVYCLRPDGRQIHNGDGGATGRSGRKKTIFMLAGSYYCDPYLLHLADSDLFDDQLRPFHQVFELLLRPAGQPSRPLDDLPQTKYFPMPIGNMVARTGWRLGADSPDALVYMRIGGTFFGNHQFRDMGTFQVYHKGMLALATGIYDGKDTHYGTDHWKAWYHATISQNGLLICDPDEPLDRVHIVNEGGQRVPNDGADHPPDIETLRAQGYEMGRVTAHAFGPDAAQPDYSYIAGDITDAYTSKVSLVTRSMVTLRLHEAACPAVLVVFDRVTSRDASFRKTWLLHTMQEPRIERGHVAVVRDEPPYRGRMEVRTLLPESPEIRTIGGPGREFWIESTNTHYLATPHDGYSEPGAWRVEVSPASPRRDDRFLHVLTVMDAGVQAGPAVQRIDGEGCVGAMLLDRAVLFGLAADPLAQAAFTLPERDEGAHAAAARSVPRRNLHILMCDLEPGGWQVTCEGKALLARASVAAAAGCLYFAGPPGRYELRRISDATPGEAADGFWRQMAEHSSRAAALCPRG